MTDKFPVRVLMAPGPVRVPQVIRQQLTFDPPYFASKDFSVVLRRIQPKLKKVFNTSYPVMIGTGSGSLGMECCVSNFFNEGDSVVVIDTGKYGSNWAKMCMNYGLDVTVLKPEKRYGSTIDTLQLEKALSKKPMKGLFITHVETTTAVKNPIELYTMLAREINFDTLVIVDCVSSLLTEIFRSEYFDVVISASQKGLQLPPGLFFMSCSPKALERAKRSKLPRFYFDVNVEIERTKNYVTTFTPAADLIYALDVALTHILEIGVFNIVKRLSNIADRVRSSLSKKFELFSESPCNAVTAVYCLNSNQFVGRCYDKKLVLGSGLRELSNKIFRFAHIGWDIRDWEIDFALRVINEVYRERFEKNRN